MRKNNRKVFVGIIGSILVSAFAMGCGNSHSSEDTPSSETSAKADENKVTAKLDQKLTCYSTNQKAKPYFHFFITIKDNAASLSLVKWPFLGAEIFPQEITTEALAKSYYTDLKANQLNGAQMVMQPQLI